ncbi:hypothetical protein C8R45DRAFT_993356 [Mycena sanguinolenta]|nr:hypothetical protein C8R45DRAFT_993356 [Mycena sanguinolenta]
MLDCMEADRVRLLRLEAQIMDLEHSLSGLRGEEAQVRERLDAYKYPVTVLTLPNEVTSEIFIQFLPIYPDIPPLVGLASPTSLMLVCATWREVALATPTLWRAIEFSDDYIPYDQIRRISDTWIGRSGSCPLSIDISLENPDFLHQILTKSLAVATKRWEHLEAWIPKASFPKIDIQMPLLRSLHLSSPIFDDEDFPSSDMPRHLSSALSFSLALSARNSITIADAKPCPMHLAP